VEGAIKESGEKSPSLSWGEGWGGAKGRKGLLTAMGIVVGGQGPSRWERRVRPPRVGGEEEFSPVGSPANPERNQEPRGPSQSQSVEN